MEWVRFRGRMVMQAIRPMGRRDAALLGTALTVRVPGGDNAFIHKALDLAQPGDVLVIDGGGCTCRALMGEIMFTYAQNVGIAGVVVDGAIRDQESLERLGLPVYAAAVTPQGPYKNGPGEINVPIACGGQVVFPGDILVGDGDGVVVVRRQEAELVLAEAREKAAYEKQLLHRYHTEGNDTPRHRDTYDRLIQGLKTGVYHRGF